MKRGVSQIIITLSLFLLAIVLVIAVSKILQEIPPHPKVEKKSEEFSRLINEKNIYLINTEEANLALASLFVHDVLHSKNVKVISFDSKPYLSGSIIVLSFSHNTISLSNNHLMTDLFEKCSNVSYIIKENNAFYENACFKTSFKIRNKFYLSTEHLLERNHNISIEGGSFKVRVFKDSNNYKIKIEGKNIEESTLNLQEGDILHLTLFKEFNNLRLEWEDRDGEKVISTIIDNKEEQLKIESPKLLSFLLRVSLKDTNLQDYSWLVTKEDIKRWTSENNIVIILFKNFFNIDIRGVTKDPNVFVITSLEGKVLDSPLVVKAQRDNTNCIVHSGKLCLVWKKNYGRGIIYFVPYEIKDYIKDPLLKDIKEELGD